MFNRIMVPVDGSQEAARAVAVAVEEAHHQRPPAEVTLVNVISPIPMAKAIPGGLDYLRRYLPDLEEDRRNEARGILAEASRSLREQGISVQTIVLEGHPAEAILNYAREQSQDLIVMGSRGLTGTSEFLLGSVSNAVVHHAGCAVLIVR
jgi:nucleotide-binding universal stress UspA family protein